MTLEKFRKLAIKYLNKECTEDELKQFCELLKNKQYEEEFVFFLKAIWLANNEEFNNYHHSVDFNIILDEIIKKLKIHD